MASTELSPQGNVQVGGICQAWDYLCADFPDDPTPEQQELIDAALEAATEALWSRTKRRFGLCSVKYRPCKDSCMNVGLWPLLARGSWRDTTGWSWPFPALVGGNWINIACGICTGDHCSCGPIERVNLPYPVFEVQEVRVDGEVLDPDAYVMYNRRELIRVDGGDWPECNDLMLDDTIVGTWSVTARYGEPVPASGKMAVGELASQIYRRCAGSGAGDCVIPAGVVKEITRQGVKKVFFDAESAFMTGRIGLYYTDMFISTFNPSGTGLASIFNIDGPRRRYES